MSEHERDWSPLMERPNWREFEPEPTSKWGWLLIALLAMVAGAGYYYYFLQEQQLAPTPPALSKPEPHGKAPPAEPEKPAIRHPVPEVQPEKPLPALDQSDSLIGELVARLMGKKAFDSFVGPAHLVRRIVATVDNLPRKIAPMRTRAVRPVPGRFTTDAGNRARYASHVKVFQSLDARSLVQGYLKLYPLFQSAYAELGHPDGHFNDRLVEAIDDMLAAPELKGTPELVQPKVLYHYADPGLEGRSAGQKIMMRLGGENAAKVKSKLREIRRELTMPQG